MKIPALTYKPFIYADEWAEQNVNLIDTGKFSFNETPFYKLPTHCASDLAHYCRVVISACAQTGKTTAILNILGWMANYDESNSLIIMDSLKSCQKLSKNRIKPFLRDQAGVRSLIKGEHILDKSADTMNISLGTGHNLLLGSSASASDLCSFPVKYAFMDELDRFCDELTNEGDPVLLVFKRQLRYRGMAVLTSTPTTDKGRINQHFLLGTQRYWGVICECGKFIKVEYDSINYNTNTPTYTCPHCGIVYDEQGIIKLKHCYSEPYNDTPFIDKWGRICESFKITAPLVHNIYTWDSIKKEEMQARALGVSSLRSFINTTIGEPFNELQEVIINENALLAARRYFNKDSLPNWVSRITIGVDTQDNRFEYVILGSSNTGTRIAFIQHGIVLGNLSEHEVWDELTKRLTEYKATTKDGNILYPSIVCIDSGGHYTQQVYAYCMLQPRIRAIKGRSYSMHNNETSLIASVSRVNVRALGSGIGTVELTHINTRYAKDLIREQLTEIQLNPAKSHWLMSADVESNINENFIEQLNSEYKCISSSGNITWKLKQGVRNECLDCTIYALAAIDICRLSKGDAPTFTMSSVKATNTDILETVKDDSDIDNSPITLNDFDLNKIVPDNKKCKHKTKPKYKVL